MTQRTLPPPAVPRRQWLRATVAAATLLALPRYARAGDDLELVSPFGHRPGDYEAFLVALFDAVEARRLVERLWFAYRDSERFDFGEWAVIYTFAWWRTLPARSPERVRASMAGRRMADALRRQRPEHPAGHFWGATHTAAEQLSRGILEALQLTPGAEATMRDVHRRFPDYFYGGAAMMLGKMHVKVPPFPVGVGDLSQAPLYLEECRRHQQGHLAYWYLFQAEADHVMGRTTAALALLDRMAVEVRPSNHVERYVLETSLADALAFRHAVAVGTYNRFTWDPLLEPVRRVPWPTA